MPRFPKTPKLLPASTLTPVLPKGTAPDALYPDDLTYLQDELRWVRLRAERIHAEHKLSTVGLGEPPRGRRYGDDDDEPPEVLGRRVTSLRKVETDVRRGIDLHLNAHRAAGKPVALDRMADLYGLDAFERTVVLLAASTGFSSSFKDVWELVSPGGMSSSLEVEVVFNFMELPWADRVRRRAVFSPAAPLCANHLVQVELSGRITAPEDLLRADVQIRQQTFAYLCGVPGLDAEFGEFSSLEEPKVQLSQVVLPDHDRRRILSVVDRHADYLTARRDWGFDEVIRYGKGILMLFHGKPGTGKTMTAHAVAHHLGKRILNVDIPTFLEHRDADRFLPGLFREAKLQDALLFFDECETLFAGRMHGNSLMTLLLTELERFEGVAVLATNLPQVLDEALDRRILVKVRFDEPDRQARREIWQKHLPPEAPLADDVDLDALADRFEMTGGYIKNAVLVAVADAVHTGGEPRQIAMAMLERAARDQLQRPGDDRLELVQPKVRLTDLVLPQDLRGQVVELVSAARSRRTVLERWGIGTHLSSGKGVAALLHGLPGTGKTLCAEAIAAELCKPLLTAQVPTLLSKWVGGTEANLKGLFTDAKAAGAVLLLDECDTLLASRDELTHHHDISVVNVLLGLIERHDGVVLLATNRPGKLDGALARRLGWTLEFPLPDAWGRACIWRGLLPETVPVRGRLDFERLGRKFAMAGGHIRNAVFKAAFRAASRDDVLTMADLEDAAREEMTAAGLEVEPVLTLSSVAEG
ncbi:MAG: ATP-binding protein [Myxococcota bacterium]